MENSGVPVPGVGPAWRKVRSRTRFLIPVSGCFIKYRDWKVSAINLLVCVVLLNDKLLIFIVLYRSYSTILETKPQITIGTLKHANGISQLMREAPNNLSSVIQRMFNYSNIARLMSELLSMATQPRHGISYPNP